MAGILDGLVKGLASLAPQDDPDVKIFNAQNELKEIEEKETAIFAQLGRQVYEAGGKDAYPEAGVQLDALATNRAQIQQKVRSVPYLPQLRNSQCRGLQVLLRLRHPASGSGSCTAEETVLHFLRYRGCGGYEILLRLRYPAGITDSYN